MRKNDRNGAPSRSATIVTLTGALLLSICVMVSLRGRPSASAASAATDSALQSSSTTRESDAARANYTTHSLRGRVVWLNEALHRRFGIQTVEGVKENVIALESNDGQLHPIVEDRRGRAFRKDPRLRKMDLELQVRRYAKSPMIQIIEVHEHNKGDRFIIDYWCDVCSIPMYEFGPCDCCQDQNRLRKRPAESFK